MIAALDRMLALLLLLSPLFAVGMLVWLLPAWLVLLAVVLVLVPIGFREEQRQLTARAASRAARRAPAAPAAR